MRIGNRIGVQFDSGVPYWNPLNLTLAEITGGIRLAWDNINGEDGFEVWISVGGGVYYLLATTAENVVTYDDMADHGGQSLAYKVRYYVGTNESEFSDESAITITEIPYLSLSSGSQYAYVADNGGLDIEDNSFTLAGWFKILGASVGDYSFMAGKSVYGALSGRYHIAYGNDNHYLATGQGSLGSKNCITTEPLVNDGIWHYHLLSFDALGNIIYKIDDVLRGSSTDLGTTAPMDNVFEFYLGAANDGTGTGVTKIAKVAMKDVIFYQSKLTAAEQTDLYNGIIKNGYKAYWKCDAYPLLDETGNFNLTGVNLSSANILTTPSIP